MGDFEETRDPWEALYPNDLKKQEIMRHRSDLYVQIVKAIRKKGLSQHEVSKILDIPQPRVSDLMRGKLENFSGDTLHWFLTKLGYVKSGGYVQEKRGA